MGSSNISAQVETTEPDHISLSYVQTLEISVNVTFWYFQAKPLIVLCVLQSLWCWGSVTKTFNFKTSCEWSHLPKKANWNRRTKYVSGQTTTASETKFGWHFVRQFPPPFVTKVKLIRNIWALDVHSHSWRQLFGVLAPLFQANWPCTHVHFVHGSRVA